MTSGNLHLPVEGGAGRLLLTGDITLGGVELAALAALELGAPHRSGDRGAAVEARRVGEDLGVVRDPVLGEAGPVAHVVVLLRVERGDVLRRDRDTDVLGAGGGIDIDRELAGDIRPPGAVAAGVGQVVRLGDLHDEPRRADGVVAREGVGDGHRMVGAAGDERAGDHDGPGRLLVALGLVQAAGLRRRGLRRPVLADAGRRHVLVADRHGVVVDGSDRVHLSTGRARGVLDPVQQVAVECLAVRERDRDGFARGILGDGDATTDRLQVARATGLQRRVEPTGVAELHVGRERVVQGHRTGTGCVQSGQVLAGNVDGPPHGLLVRLQLSGLLGSAEILAVADAATAGQRVRLRELAVEDEIDVLGRRVRNRLRVDLEVAVDVFGLVRHRIGEHAGHEVGGGHQLAGAPDSAVADQIDPGVGVEFEDLREPDGELVAGLRSGGPRVPLALHRDGIADLDLLAVRPLDLDVGDLDGDLVVDSARGDGCGTLLRRRGRHARRGHRRRRLGRGRRRGHRRLRRGGRRRLGRGRRCDRSGALSRCRRRALGGARRSGGGRCFARVRRGHRGDGERG